ncbi:MAG: hypothetical protein ACRDTH_05715 [Pseudonocardiaceae bacterium]
MSYNPGLQAMLAAQQTAAEAARRASIVAQQSQCHAQRKAKQQAAQRVAAARPAPRPQIGTPHLPSGVYGQPSRRITAPPSQSYYGSTGRYVDEDDWIAVVVGVIVIIVIIAVL